jgi:RND superfamily putative drug exporter
MRAARWSATHPWSAIGAWVVFVAVAVGLAIAVPTQETTDADYRVGESGRADAMIAEGHLDRADTESVLIAASSGEIDAGAAEQAATETATALESVPEVATVGTAQWNQDGTAMLLTVEMTPDAEDAEGVSEAVASVQADHPELEVRSAGDLSIDAAINERVGEDLASAEVISLPITLLLMLLAFGALIAAGIPVLLAGSSVAATLGLMSVLSHLVPAELTVSSMIVLIGMAVGVDYSLFYI